jgi:hypothetical protein
MAGVINGQPVNASVTNAAFLYKNADDTTTHKLNLHAPTAVSGPFIEDLQLTVNNLASSGSGVQSLAVSGQSGITGAVTLSASGGITLTQSGHNIQIYSSTAVGTGTVTSVAMTVPSIMNVSGSPVTSSGTLAVTLANENGNTVFAGPTGGSATTPTFRSLVAEDISAIAVTGISADAGSTFGHAGIILAPSGAAVITRSGQTVTIFAPASGSGTVTSVNATVPSALLSVSGVPITSSGTIAVGLVNASSATFFAGPTSGAAAAPSYRSITAVDIVSVAVTGISTDAGATYTQGGLQFAASGAAQIVQSGHIITFYAPSGGSSASGSGTMHADYTTSSGTFNVPSNVSVMDIFLMGGGGGGGGGGSGGNGWLNPGNVGGSGGGGGGNGNNGSFVYLQKIPVTPGGTLSLTVGTSASGGTGGAAATASADSPNDGNNGLTGGTGGTVSIVVGGITYTAAGGAGGTGGAKGIHSNTGSSATPGGAGGSPGGQNGGAGGDFAGGGQSGAAGTSGSAATGAVVYGNEAGGAGGAGGPHNTIITGTGGGGGGGGVSGRNFATLEVFLQNYALGTAASGGNGALYTGGAGQNGSSAPYGLGGGGGGGGSGTAGGEITGTNITGKGGDGAGGGAPVIALYYVS